MDPEWWLGLFHTVCAALLISVVAFYGLLVFQNRSKGTTAAVAALSTATLCLGVLGYVLLARRAVRAA